jgi:hypothetical protein
VVTSFPFKAIDQTNLPQNGHKIERRSGAVQHVLAIFSWQKI